MTAHATVRLFDIDEATRQLRIAKILLERASDQLEELEHHPDAGPEARAEIGEVLWLVFAATEELPAS